MGSHDTLKVVFFWLTFPTTAVNLVKNDWHAIPTGFLHKFGLVWPLGGEDSYMEPTVMLVGNFEFNP